MNEDRVAALVVLNEGADGVPVRGWFERQGFMVGPLVGISFSIEGPRAGMEEAFSGYGEAEQAGGERELALDALPEDVRSAVRAVTLEAPPDYGPWNP